MCLSGQTLRFEKTVPDFVANGRHKIGDRKKLSAKNFKIFFLNLFIYYSGILSTSISFCSWCFCRLVGLRKTVDFTSESFVVRPNTPSRLGPFVPPGMDVRSRNAPVEKNSAQNFFENHLLWISPSFKEHSKHKFESALAVCPMLSLVENHVVEKEQLFWNDKFLRVPQNLWISWHW